MPRINWNSIDREEQSIEEDESLTPSEKARLIRELHRGVQEEFQEQQREEYRDQFGW